jgi:AcrR family transcriptional regulator
MTDPTRQADTDPRAAAIAYAAQAVFLRRGYAAATLDEIAGEAGRTRAEVDEVFTDKYLLFLTAFADRFQQRFDGYGEAVFAHEDIEDSYRALARYWCAATRSDPEWSRILIELLLHGSRDPNVGAPMQTRRDMGLGDVASVFDKLAAQHGIEYTRSTREIALVSGALNRGLAIEQLLDPNLSDETVEESYVAYMRGLTRPSQEKGTRK